MFWSHVTFISYFQMEVEISKKYKDRIVNIMGEINTVW
jgi:hypothetical protein